MEKNQINGCTNDEMEIELQNACSCNNGKSIEIMGIPDEYFYNTCDCLNCECTEEENFCGCVGTIADPLGTNHQSCICENLNIFE